MKIKRRLVKEIERRIQQRKICIVGEKMKEIIRGIKKDINEVKENEK